MLACLFTMAACWAVIAAFPETVIGKGIRHALVERPAARLSRFTRGDAAVIFLLMLATAMVTLIGEGDGIRLLTLAAPDVAIWITTFEVSAYVDILVTLGAAASGLRLREVAARYRAGVVARRGAARACRRATRVRRVRPAKADNDSDGHLSAIARAA